MQLRVKLFRLSVDKSSISGAAAAAGGGGGAGGGAGGSSVDSAAASSEWVGVGTGPVKVLSSGGDGAAAYRIVMRREEKKGGLGSKLILNARLQELNAVERLGASIFASAARTSSTSPRRRPQPRAAAEVIVAVAAGPS